MRKDLRVGLGIGGVLLAVLVVALIVRSHGKDKNKLAKAGPPDTEVTDTGGTEPTPPGDGSQTPTADASSVAPGDTLKKDIFDPEGEGGTRAPGTTGRGSTNGGPTPAAGAPAGGSPDDWERLLNASNPGPVHSMTPAAGQPNARPGRASRGGDKPALPPGLVAKSGGTDGSGTPSGSGTGADPLKPTGNTTTTGGGRSSPSSGGSPRSHVIQRGETFASIARTVYGDGRYYLQIQKANPGLEPSALKPGTRINLPELASAAGGESRTGNRSSHAGQAGANGAASIDRKTQYKVESGDSLYKIAEKLYGDGTKMDAIYDANKQTIGPDPRKLKLGMVLKLPEQPTVTTASR